MADRDATLSSDTVAAQLGDRDRTTVDVRPIAAYNGWRLRDEPRGGHLPGATSFPLDWFDLVDVGSYLRDRGPPVSRPVTVYGYDAEGVWTAVDSLTDYGYERVTAYTDFLEEWVVDPDRPLEQLARYERLVYPEWVQQLLAGGTPPNSPDGDHVICHVHYDNEADYDAGHIPEAVPVDTLALESPTDWNRRLPAALERRLREHGIRHDTTVVLYGRPIEQPVEEPEVDPMPGHLGAMRAAVILLYAGVEDVRVLNGGLAAWQAAGFELTREPNAPNPVDSFGAEIPGRPALMIDTNEAKTWLDADRKELVSVRSEQELDGETSGYTYISEEGHIPGAVFVPSGSDADHVEPYRDPDQTMREYPAVAAMWKQEGVDPDRQLAFYCGTGWRSSEAFMHAYLMGWSDIAVYDGGWHEWSHDPENPVG